jgi:hypothetical protein
VGCLEDYKDCKVEFVLNYQVGDGAIQTAGAWPEVYDGNVTRIDIDLSALAGKSVKFFLGVRADGSARDDAAFWLLPQIYRP